MFPEIPLLLLIFTLTSILSATLLLLLLLRKHDRNRRPHPPGPPAFPVIGNLPMLGKLPHRTLQAMAQTYGPIMSLRLGYVPTIVLSSSEAAQMFLKSNDVVFSNRPSLQASDCFSYGSKGLVFSEYGAYWRNMRKLCTFHLLSASKDSSFAPLRKKEVEQTVKSLRRAAAVGEVVDLSEVVQNLVEDVVYKIVLGRSRDDEFDLKGLLHEGMRLSGAFNLADYVPWLGAFDLQGLTRAVKKISIALDQVLEKIIKEHEQGSDAHDGENHKDFIDTLLSLMQQPIDLGDEQVHVIDRSTIKAIVSDMIAAAFETSASVIVWTLSELLRHPRVMKNLQDELADVVGMNRLVEESDLAKLSYLDIVIKETLRLYPAGALIPRQSTEDAMINGYYIGKKSTILINLWAIGRDPEVWSDNAEEFYPERFIGNNLDFRGYNFQFIPFGYGRRGCPGIHLGLTLVKLIVAQLSHCFNWELPWNINPDELDMSEKFGLTLPKAKHLLAVPTYRLMYEAHNESN